MSLREGIRLNESLENSRVILGEIADDLARFNFCFASAYFSFAFLIQAASYSCSLQSYSSWMRCKATGFFFFFYSSSILSPANTLSCRS